MIQQQKAETFRINRYREKEWNNEWEHTILCLIGETKRRISKKKKVQETVATAESKEKKTAKVNCDNKSGT